MDRCCHHVCGPCLRQLQLWNKHERARHLRGNKNYFLGWRCEQRDPTIQRNVRKPDWPRGLLTWPAATDWQIAAMCHSSCLHSYLGKTNRAHAWIIRKNTFDVTTWIIWDLSETFSGSHEEGCSVYQLRSCFAQALAKLARPNRYNKLDCRAPHKFPWARGASVCGERENHMPPRSRFKFNHWSWWFLSNHLSVTCGLPLPWLLQRRMGNYKSSWLQKTSFISLRRGSANPPMVPGSSLRVPPIVGGVKARPVTTGGVSTRFRNVNWSKFVVPWALIFDQFPQMEVSPKWDDPFSQDFANSGFSDWTWLFR